ncbi:MAG: STAS domain-containing protein [Desulfovibrionaceae bacterium]
MQAYSTTENGNSIILSGKLTTLSVPEINAVFEDIIRSIDPPCYITINLNQVVYLNATVLRNITYLAHFLFSINSRLYFTGAKGQVKEFIALSGLFEICPLL